MAVQHGCHLSYPFLILSWYCWFRIWCKKWCRSCSYWYSTSNTFGSTRFIFITRSSIMYRNYSTRKARKRGFRSWWPRWGRSRWSWWWRPWWPWRGARSHWISCRISFRMCQSNRNVCDNILLLWNLSQCLGARGAGDFRQRSDCFWNRTRCGKAWLAWNILVLIASFGDNR